MIALKTMIGRQLGKSEMPLRRRRVYRQYCVPLSEFQSPETIVNRSKGSPDCSVSGALLIPAGGRHRSAARGVIRPRDLRSPSVSPSALRTALIIPLMFRSRRLKFGRSRRSWLHASSDIRTRTSTSCLIPLDHRRNVGFSRLRSRSRSGSVFRKMSISAGQGIRLHPVPTVRCRSYQERSRQLQSFRPRSPRSSYLAALQPLGPRQLLKEVVRPIIAGLKSRRRRLLS